MVEGKSVLRKYHKIVRNYVEKSLDESYANLQYEQYPDKEKVMEEKVLAWNEIDAFLTRELRKED
ncbi:MAG: hypothetical protein VW443_00345 [Pseudomonadales bacterium]